MQNSFKDIRIPGSPIRAPPRVNWQNENRPRSKVRESPKLPSDGDDNSLRSYGTRLNIVFGTVLLSLGLLWSAIDCFSNLASAALRAMTGLECVAN